MKYMENCSSCLRSAIDSSFWRTSCFQDTCAATDQNDFSGSQTGNSVDVLFHIEPGSMAYRIFTKIRAVESHETSYMELVRLNRILTGIVDTFRLAALSAGNSFITL